MERVFILRRFPARTWVNNSKEYNSQNSSKTIFFISHGGHHCCLYLIHLLIHTVCGVLFVTIIFCLLEGAHGLFTHILENYFTGTQVHEMKDISKIDRHHTTTTTTISKPSAYFLRCILWKRAVLFGRDKRYDRLFTTFCSWSLRIGKPLMASCCPLNSRKSRTEDVNRNQEWKYRSMFKFPFTFKKLYILYNIFYMIYMSKVKNAYVLHIIWWSKSVRFKKNRCQKFVTWKRFSYVIMLRHT